MAIDANSMAGLYFLVVGVVLFAMLICLVSLHRDCSEMEDILAILMDDKLKRDAEKSGKKDGF